MATHLRPILSVLFGVALLLAGTGLQFTLLPLRGSAEGFSTVALGIIGSAYYIGFVSGCVLAPYLILRAGHIRAFTALVAIATAMALAYALAATPIAWVAFRLLTGFALAGFYLVVESWLNDHAASETRGRVMSAYIMVNFGALAVGQMLVPLYPIDNAGPFMVAAILTSLAIIPVALTRSAQPAPITIVSFRPRQLYDATPVALVASFMIGLAMGAFWSLGPVSVAANGFQVQEVAGFMSIVVVGGAIAQWPAGRFSDRMDRRVLLLVFLIGATVMSLALWLFAARGMTLVALGFLFGALMMPCYALAAAHGYDKTDAGDMVATAATLLLANGLGATLGPLLAAELMATVGPRALFLFIAIAQALLAGFVLYRVRVQPPLKRIDKTEFDLATTAQWGTVVTTEELNPDDPLVAVPEPYQPPAAEETPETGEAGVVPEPEARTDDGEPDRR